MTLLTDMDYYVIYKKPRDFPKDFVVRRYHMNDEGVQSGIAETFKSLDAARKAIPPGLVCFERRPDDDPVIAETWL